MCEFCAAPAAQVVYIYHNQVEMQACEQVFFALACAHDKVISARSTVFNVSYIIGNFDDLYFSHVVFNVFVGRRSILRSY